MPGRGRGRGRGRGGRGRGGSRGRGGGRNRTYQQQENTVKEQKIYNIETDPKEIFTGTASCKEHLEAQNTNRTRYAATLSVMIENKIQVAQNACIRALAMAWARGDQELAKAFLKLRSQFGLVEVLRAVTMLDAGRQCRVLEKKLKCLQLSGVKVKPKKLGKLKSDIDNLNKLKPPAGSASGAVCKHVATWVRDFTQEDLEFFAVNFPKEPWKKLADICHLHPAKDFAAAPWFLPYSFGTGLPPERSVVQYSQSLSQDNVNELVAQHDIPYSIVKAFKAKLKDGSKKRISQYESKIDTVLWYYEDLACPETDKVIDQRLAAGEAVNLPNGKLLERLLTILLMRNPSLASRGFAREGIIYTGEKAGVTNFFTRLTEIAEPRLTSIELSLESPVVVIGDASGSMEVAIKTSTIIASLLTSICSAKLVFFNNETRDAPFLPKTVKEMLQLAVTTLASGGTTPAASLYPFYEKKEIVKSFIVVTDEEENGQCHGDYFADLYKKYHDEVYPAHLVFVSFLRGQHARGQMVTALEGKGFSPMQLRLEGSRPDLCKLDDLFAQLSADTTSSFTEQLQEAEREIRSVGLAQYLTTVGDKSSKKFENNATE